MSTEKNSEKNLEAAALLYGSAVAGTLAALAGVALIGFFGVKGVGAVMILIAVAIFFVGGQAWCRATFGGRDRNNRLLAQQKDKENERKHRT